MPRPRIERTRKGDFHLRLEPEERRLLADLPDQLRNLIASADPSTRRLFPTAYEDDPEREAEYRALVGDELVQGKLDTLRVVQDTVHEERLAQEEVEAWLRALNDLRLTLGTLLDVTEDMDDAAMLEGPAAHTYTVYHFLGWLQEQVIRALADAS